MAAESAGQTMLDGRPITSPAGAIGLMQVIPETYAEMRLRHGLGADPYDPRDNILAGAAYLRAMYDRYGYPGFFAAYNVGPARFEGYLQHGVPLPEETLHYLMTIGPDVREAIVAQRPDVAAGLTARVARTVASCRKMACSSRSEPHSGPQPKPHLDRSAGIFRARIHAVTAPCRVDFSCRSQAHAASLSAPRRDHDQTSDPSK
jgi:hypothetical protein